VFVCEIVVGFVSGGGGGGKADCDCVVERGHVVLYGTLWVSECHPVSLDHILPFSVLMTVEVSIAVEDIFQ
jgi:hypothetical protein